MATEPKDDELAGRLARLLAGADPKSQ
jgi:hypothetical protein